MPILAEISHETGDFPLHAAQFFLGPAGSGAPWHFHSDAFNALAHGTKRWFVTPPGSDQNSFSKGDGICRQLMIITIYGHITLDSTPSPGNSFSKFKVPAAEWIRQREGATGKPVPLGQDPVLECHQQAGDLIFIPRDWAHSTINLQESVGIAAEFNGKTFTF